MRASTIASAKTSGSGRRLLPRSCGWTALCPWARKDAASDKRRVRVRQPAHAAGGSGGHYVLACEPGGVGEDLAQVFWLQVGVFPQNLRLGAAVGE